MMQRIAIENFERGPLKLDYDISVSLQILTWYAHIKKVSVDPISDNKYRHWKFKNAYLR